ncbi:formin-like protein 5, partial [Catharus ustulatus]|uniref:formin-like protein 5 n=1 Tax=Catharus ustulatus TaxID=91951 RepID=UPI0014095402
PAADPATSSACADQERRGRRWGCLYGATNRGGRAACNTPTAPQPRSPRLSRLSETLQAPASPPSPGCYAKAPTPLPHTAARPHTPHAPPRTPPTGREAAERVSLIGPGPRGAVTSATSEVHKGQRRRVVPQTASAVGVEGCWPACGGSGAARPVRLAMTRGNQRELARQKNLKKTQEIHKGKRKEDSLSASQRKQRDSEIMQQKQKAANERKSLQAGAK